MLRRSYKTLALFAALIVMLACVPTLGSAPAVPTFDPNSPLTAIVETAAVAATQTQLYAPPTNTSTPLPTNTPIDTPTATATFLFALPTIEQPPTQVPLGVSEKSLDCQVISAEPKSLVAASASFIGKWTIANIGKDSWTSDSFDYRYESGDKIHLQSIYDFPVNVQPGSIVELTVDMQAPSAPGEYTTVWMLYRSNRSFCEMKLTITVQ